MYHFDRIRRAPGWKTVRDVNRLISKNLTKKAASTKPIMKRMATMPEKLVTTPLSVLIIPQI